MELIRALGVAAETPGEELETVAALLELGAAPPPDVYTDLFVFHLYPYASVYLNPRGMLGGEARDRIGGFWSAVGHVPPSEPDHLATLLGLYARLVEAEREVREPAEGKLLQRARETLLVEHLASWVFAYLEAVRRIAPPFYRRWAELLRTVLLEELAQNVVLQTLEISHFREVPGLPDPRATEPERFVEAVLAPACSGMIVSRASLADCARSLGLGFRLGERAYQLKALLSQNPGAVLAWLADLADGWARWHTDSLRELPAVAEHWHDRAVSSRDLLRELAGGAGS